MPLWAWFAFVLMIAYNCFVLWRAWRQKYFKYGPIIYSLIDGPIYFWFFAVLFTLCEIFLIGLFTLIVTSAIWSPFFHQ